MDSNELRQMLSECCQFNSDATSQKYLSLLIKLFGGESSSQFVNNILLTDTSERRSLFYVIEQFLLLDWQQNNYKSLSHPLIYQICDALLLIADQIQFSDSKIWFGGTSNVRTYSLTCSDSKTTQATDVTANENYQRRQNSVPYFSICILMLSLTNRSTDIIAKEHVKQFFRRLESEFCSSSLLLIDVLLENDERCLSTLIALLKMRYTVNDDFLIPGMLNPTTLFILLLCKIEFDPMVPIDWICSEPELTYLFLKSYSFQFSQLSSKQIFKICNSIQEIPKIDEFKYDIVRVETDLPKQTQFHFEIEELHGEQNVIRHIVIPTDSNDLISKRKIEEFPDSKNLFKSFSSFCANLKTKLNKLSNSLHLSVTHISKNLSAIESLTELKSKD